MTGERKYGELRLEGSNPMVLIEAEGQINETWTPEQESIASAVSRTIKSYLKTTQALASEQYAHLGDMIPAYMRDPGNLLIAICTDGIVVRYEKKVHEGRKAAVTVLPQGIGAGAAFLSQNLVHIASPDAPLPQNENFGVELKLSAYSPQQGTSHDIVSSRIWFQVTSVSPQAPNPPGAKPFCLLSVRNQLQLELHGFLLGNKEKSEQEQPFIAHSTIGLVAGWECIEVFPGLDLNAWNIDSAPLWAERDVLGAVLIAQTAAARLSNLDPRASTRRLYASLLGEFKVLLDSNPEREQALQTFLQKHPVLLCPTHVQMWPKLAFGATVTDFVFRDATHEYLLVELERSTLQLFRQDGHPTADLTHAQGQIIDWKRYLEDNLHTAQRELGLVGISTNPGGLLVIGRSHSLLPKDRRKLQTMMNESPKLRIMTYDDVYENAKAVFENLLGPMWDTGGATQIYYPST
jgi:Domain of unknown function (DUF4263)